MDLRDALHVAAGAPVDELDVADLRRRIADRRRRRHGMAGGAVAAVVAVAIVAAVLGLGAGGHDRRTRIATGGSTTTSATRPAVARPGGWTRLPDAPLSGRYGASSFWTGHELIVLGGWTDDPCPPNADCMGSDPKRDGAAYDPSTRSWRRIARLPISVLRAGAVVDGDLYVLGADASTSTTLLRYDPADDRWGTLPLPPLPSSPNVTLADDGGRLLLSLGSHERGEARDQVYDPTDGTWTPLPRDPLAPSFDRTMMAVDGRLYLLAKDFVPNPGAGRTPSLVRAAVLERGRWRRLPDSDSVGFGAFETAGVIVNPEPGSVDGGPNAYGRSYPNSLWLDTRTDTWGTAPPYPVDPRRSWSHGIAAAGDGWVAFGDEVLDVRHRVWRPLATPTTLRREQPTSTWGDHGLFVFGGATIVDAYTSPAVLHHDLWQWVPPGDS